LKAGAVTATKFKPKWYGYLATDAALSPQTTYAAIARTQTGWQAELAHAKTPDDWEAEARRLSGQMTGDASVQADAATGVVRIAIVQDGKITALFFASPNPVALSRTAVIGLIGSDTGSLAALAGRNPADMPDAGATVCACFNVGRNTLLGAIAGGAHSVAALGEATCAGTNCGSCKPELKALLSEQTLKVAAQ